MSKTLVHIRSNNFERSSSSPGVKSRCTPTGQTFFHPTQTPWKKPPPLIYLSNYSLSFSPLPLCLLFLPPSFSVNPQTKTPLFSFPPLPKPLFSLPKSNLSLFKETIKSYISFFQPKAITFSPHTSVGPSPVSPNPSKSHLFASGTMSSNRRGFVVRHPVIVDIGCSCRRPKLSSYFSSLLPKFRLPISPDPFSASTTTTISTNYLWDTSLTVTTASSPLMSSPSLRRYSLVESPKWRPKKKTGKAKKKGVVEESVAVVKESSDPYLDFRESMLQMIMEMEIYAWDDLRDLLRRFLALNSPSHHHLILQAFAEIWTGLFSAPSSSSTSTSTSTSASASASASCSRPGGRRR